MIIPIYLCDDVPELMTQYEKLISNTILIEEYPMKIVGTFTEPKGLINTLKTELNHGNDCGIYFLDIDLNNEIDGFNLAKSIRKIDSRGFIIFITTYGNLAVETFKQQLEAMDFIVKDNIENIHTRIAACLKNAYERRLSASHAPVVSVYCNSVRLYFNESDIICIRTSDKAHYYEIITDNDTIKTRGNLNDISDKLSSDFAFCNRSTIINTQKISSIDYSKKNITMINSMTIKASPKKLNKLPSDK